MYLKNVFLFQDVYNDGIICHTNKIQILIITTRTIRSKLWPNEITKKRNAQYDI